VVLKPDESQSGKRPERSVPRDVWGVDPGGRRLRVVFRGVRGVKKKPGNEGTKT